jgi:phenylpropionate dioxygenase-like ring-hydroxylating dioxygenase large terminal subunit
MFSFRDMRTCAASDTSDAPALEWHRPLPLEGWFLVAQSRRLKTGQVMSCDLPGLSVVLYRGEDGIARALRAHCPHMGTHLQHAKVQGNALECPLHHWRWQAVKPGTPRSNDRCLPGLPLRESASGIWLCLSHTPELPSFPDATGAEEDELRYRHGRPVFLRCTWQAIMANAFDLNHFETVHQRTMHEPPEIRENGDRLDFDYSSQVVGNALADRIMRRISGDRIEVSIKLWRGSVITVRTRTRKRETFLWLSALPVPGGTLVKPVYAVRRDDWLSPLRLIAASWLFDAFLKKDVQILDRMRFAPKVTVEEDRYLWTYLRFLEKHVRHEPAEELDEESCRVD